MRLKLALGVGKHQEQRMVPTLVCNITVNRLRDGTGRHNHWPLGSDGRDEHPLGGVPRLRYLHAVDDRED